MKNQLKQPASTRLPFQPVGNQLLLEEIQTSDQSEGGIWLPEKARKPVNQGRIVAMGIDVTRLYAKAGFSLGQIVVFPLYADSQIEMNRKKYMIVPCDSIILNDFGYFQDARNSETVQEIGG